MVKWAVTSLASAGLALAACAPSSPDTVRQNAAFHQTLVSGENYQLVYRRVANMARQCWQGINANTQSQVNTDLYSDLKRGEISYGLLSMFGRDMFAVIDIQGIAPDRTQIDIYSPSGFTTNGRIASHWVTDPRAGC